MNQRIQSAVLLVFLSVAVVNGDDFHGCQESCSHSTYKRISTVVSLDPKQGYWQCLKECIRISQKNKPRIIILGPGEELPKDLYMPDKLPSAPFELLKNEKFPLPQKTECDDSPVSMDDVALPAPVSDISVKCETSWSGKSRLVIKWEKPAKGVQFLKGYQILYRFLSASPYSLNDHSCKVVDENTTMFIVNETKDFRKGPLAVAVLPVPLKTSFASPLKQFSGCEDAPKRPKRSLVIHSGSPKATSNPTTSKIIILDPTDTLPPDLVMPSKLPIPPFDLGTKSNCQRPRRGLGPKVIDVVERLRVKCEKDSKGNWIAFAQWSMPRGTIVGLEGFQVHYSVMKRNDYDPTKSFCVEVGKDVRSAKIVLGLDDTTPISLSVAPLPVYSEQTMILKKFTPCQGSESKQRKVKDAVVDDDDDDEKPSIHIGAVVGGISAGLVLIAVIAVLKYFKGTKGTKGRPTLSRNTGCVAYFSHCFESEKDVARLLSLAARLKGSHGVDCRIDLLEQRKIDELTLPVWCNMQLADSNKIVVVLCKKYLKAWKKHLQSPGTDWKLEKVGIKKILNDMSYVQQHLMETGDRTAKVICLLDEDVRLQDLPDFLRRRPVFSWPPRYSPEEETFVRALIGQEQRVLVI